MKPQRISDLLEFFSKTVYKKIASSESILHIPQKGSRNYKLKAARRRRKNKAKKKGNYLSTEECKKGKEEDLRDAKNLLKDK